MSVGSQQYVNVLPTDLREGTNSLMSLFPPQQETLLFLNSSFVLLESIGAQPFTLPWEAAGTFAQDVCGHVLCPVGWDWDR